MMKLVCSILERVKRSTQVLGMTIFFFLIMLLLMFISIFLIFGTLDYQVFGTKNVLLCV